MSKTKPFNDYVIFLERLVDKDPLFLRHNPYVKLRRYDSSEEGDSQMVVPQSNMLYLVGGNSNSFLEILNVLGLEKRVKLEQEVTYQGSRHPYPPRKQYCWSVNDNFVSSTISFETGEKPRRMTFQFSAAENFHHESKWIGGDYVDDGELDVYTLAIVTSYAARPKLNRKLNGSIHQYDLNEVANFAHGGEMTLREKVNRYGVDYDTRASVDFTIKIMKEMMKRKVPVMFSQANQPRIIAVNEVSLQY